MSESYNDNKNDENRSINLVDETMQSISTSLVSHLSSPHFHQQQHQQPNRIISTSTEQQHHQNTGQINITRRLVEQLSPPKFGSNKKERNNLIYNYKQNNSSCDYNNCTQKMNSFPHHKNLQILHRESITLPQHAESTTMTASHYQSQQKSSSNNNIVDGDVIIDDDPFARFLKRMLDQPTNESKNNNPNSSLLMLNDDNNISSSIINTNTKFHHENERFNKTREKQRYKNISFYSKILETTIDNALLSDNSNTTSKEITFPNNVITKRTFEDSETRIAKNKKQRATPPTTTNNTNKTRTTRRILSHPPYHDFSNTTDIELLNEKVGMKESFPVVLHEIIDCNKFHNIIRWNDHGRSFSIINKELFTNHILSLYFHGQKQYSSFHRQLNSYGFLRITKIGSIDRYSFYHEMFLRGRLHLAYHLPRTRQNANSVRVSLDPNTEPNFTKYPPVPITLTTISEAIAIKTVSSLEVNQNMDPFDTNPPACNNIQEDSSSSMIENLRKRNTNTVNMTTKQLQLQSIIKEITLSTTTIKRQQKYSNVLQKNKLKQFITTITTTTDSSSVPKNSVKDDDDTKQKQNNQNLEKCIEHIIPKKILMSSSTKRKIVHQWENDVVMNHQKQQQQQLDTESISSNDTINSDMIEFLNDVDL